MRAFFRITFENIEKADAVKLLELLEEILTDYPTSTKELNLVG